MSLQRYSKAALRIAQEIASRINNVNGTWYVKVLPKVLPVRVGVVPKGSIGRNPFVRMVQLVIRNSRLVVRPFSALAINHRRLLTLQYHERYGRRVLFKRPTNRDGILERLRDIFGSKERYNPHLKKEVLPNSLDEYEIGANIGYGCNAAVYALRVRNEGTSNDSPNSLKAYPLALKLMYNYELDRSSEDALWRGMGAELTPLPTSRTLLKGRMGKFTPLPTTHPNIVNMYTAFVDKMPILPGARKEYPDALPSASFYTMIVSEPKTLFIVMRRYHTTLREYLLTKRRNFWRCRALSAQLMEGLVFLYNNKVSQRDMKSDNILLQFDLPDEIPLLVISDFGCALAKGTFLVDYKDDTVDLGGNLCTRAPEVSTARPPQWVDFSLADTWAGGTLIHEIFTRVNPFYSQLKSRTYQEEEVPPLPSILPRPIRRVVRDLLRRNPDERVLPHVAANVLSLSLFRFGSDIRALFSECSLFPIGGKLRTVSRRVEKTLDNVIGMLAAETFVAQSLPPEIISRAELQLRATFLSRVRRDELWASLAYFDDSPTGSECFSDSSV